MRWNCIGRGNGARAGWRVISMSSCRLDRFFAPLLAEFTRGHQLAAHPADAGVLSADRSGQRVAAASAVVRAERDGGSAGRGLCAGREECALPLPGQAAATQGGAVFASAPTLAGFVRREVRCAAVRPDQHLFRVAAAGRRSGQAPLRLQPRQAQRLRAGGDRADRDARGLSARLRGAARQHRRQAPRCATFCARSKPNTARPSASG